MVYSLRFFSLRNAVCFIIVTYLVPVLFTFYIQDVLKLKKKSGSKRLNTIYVHLLVCYLNQLQNARCNDKEGSHDINGLYYMHQHFEVFIIIDLMMA